MTAQAQRPTRVRYGVLAMLFAAASISYGDRSALGIAGSAVAHDLHLDAVAMGYILSASAISYVLAQVPGGALLDRFGSRWIYTAAIAGWSFFTLTQGMVGAMPLAVAASAMFAMRFIVGLVSAPSVPAGARVIANWFPARERGMATAIVNAAQYFSLVVFAPLMGWLVHVASWPAVFYVMGGLGLGVAVVFPLVVQSPWGIRKSTRPNAWRSRRVAPWSISSSAQRSAISPGITCAKSSPTACCWVSIWASIA